MGNKDNNPNFVFPHHICNSKLLHKQGSNANNDNNSEYGGDYESLLKSFFVKKLFVLPVLEQAKSIVELAKEAKQVFTCAGVELVQFATLEVAKPQF